MEVSSNPNPDGRSLCGQGVLCRKQVENLKLFVSIPPPSDKKVEYTWLFLTILNFPGLGLNKTKK